MEERRTRRGKPQYNGAGDPLRLRLMLKGGKNLTTFFHLPPMGWRGLGVKQQVLKIRSSRPDMNSYNFV